MHEPQSYGHGGAGAIPGQTSAARVSARGRLGRAIALAIVFAGMGWLSLNHPARDAELPRCPTEQYLRVYCPGCGSTRATHFLLNAQLDQAVRHNPLLVLLGVPLALWLGWRTSAIVVTGRTKRGGRSLPAWLAWSALGLLVVFTIARNLPVEWAKALRPPAIDASHSVEASSGYELP
ncbi:MAG: DUF2752 domain-containing protein [Phycisphaeraceae bacterium]